MAIKEKIEQDLITALKAKEPRLSILRMLKSAIKNDEIAKRTKAGTGEDALLTDDEVLALLRRQVKQLEDALVDFQKGSRADLVEKTQTEVAVIKAYLPQGMTDVELQALVDATLAELGEAGAKDLGKIIGAVMKKAGGRADGNKVREIVLKKLGG
ncbi:MAG: GatB/YqeY domain-containing protein [Candidatus Magasanikbacteria bacterium]|nr:GatB/YqeY domain-containing protein [Candidatus Magasanikbacteria bacterium]